MVSINDNIPVKPDSPFASIASIMASTGLREAAAALYDAGAATEVPAGMRAQLDLVMNDRTAELQKAIDAAVSDIVARSGGNVNDPNILQAVASLQASRSMHDLAGRLAGAQNDIDRAQNRAQDVNDVETPQQKMTRLWAEVAKLNEDIKADLEALHKRGLIGDEEYERLKKERDRLDQLDPNDPQRLKAEQAYNKDVQAVAERAEETAKANGDSVGVELAQRVNASTEKQEENLDEIFNLGMINQQAKNNAPEAKTSVSSPTSTSGVVQSDGLNAVETSTSTLVEKEAKAAVPPTLTVTFGGFEDMEASMPQVPNAKPQSSPSLKI